MSVSRFNRTTEIMERATSMKIHLYRMRDSEGGEVGIEGCFTIEGSLSGDGGLGSGSMERADVHFLNDLLTAFKKQRPSTEGGVT